MRLKLSIQAREVVVVRSKPYRVPISRLTGWASPGAVVGDMLCNITMSYSHSAASELWVAWLHQEHRFSLTSDGDANISKALSYIRLWAPGLK